MVCGLKASRNGHRRSVLKKKEDVHNSPKRVAVVLQAELVNGMLLVRICRQAQKMSVGSVTYIVNCH